jgi:hypothetical protein
MTWVRPILSDKIASTKPISFIMLPYLARSASLLFVALAGLIKRGAAWRIAWVIFPTSDLVESPRSNSYPISFAAETSDASNNWDTSGRLSSSLAHLDPRARKPGVSC